MNNIETLTPPALFAFNIPLGRDEGPNTNPVNLICAANEARFTSTHYSEPLTAYTLGWKDPENIDQLIQEIFPEVTVGRRFEFKSALNAEAFLSEADDIRAIGSPFKRIEYKGTTTNEKTHNKGLTVRCDHDDELEDNWRERKTEMLLQRLLRNDLRRGIAVVDAAANNQARTFSSSTNPDSYVRTELKAATDITGIRPNVVLFGEAAWDLRLDAYELQDTPYAGRAASMTIEQLATKYMVDKVRVIKARYQSTATAKAVVVASLVYHYLAFPGATKDDPSNIKRFITPTESGRFRVYVQEYEKFTDISVEHYSNIVATSTLGVRKITAS